MSFLRANAVRVYALVASLVALVAYYLPTLPTDLILGVAAAALGVAGEAVQRVTDRASE